MVSVIFAEIVARYVCGKARVKTLISVCKVVSHPCSQEKKRDVGVKGSMRAERRDD